MSLVDDLLGTPGGAPKVEPVLVCMDDVRPEPVPWLWKSWLPLEALAVLDGDPGLGKSTLTLDLAARVSRGWAMPPGGGPAADPAGVVLLSAEDSLKHTIRPRLEVAGADLTRVHHFDAVRQGEAERAPVLPWDMDLLADWVEGRGVRLIIVDPLTAYLTQEHDAHKDQDVRQALRPLAKLAERLHVCILFLRHLNKLSTGAALYRGTGSIAITGSARAAMVSGRDPEDESRHVLAMNKLNLAARPASLAYRLVPVGDVTRVEWLGETELLAHEIIGHPAAGKPYRTRATAELGTVLSSLLPCSPPGWGYEEIAEALKRTGHGTPRKQTVEEALRQFRREGAGRRGSPVSWWVEVSVPYPATPVGGYGTETDPFPDTIPD